MNNVIHAEHRFTYNRAFADAKRAFDDMCLCHTHGLVTRGALLQAFDNLINTYRSKK